LPGLSGIAKRSGISGITKIVNKKTNKYKQIKNNNTNENRNDSRKTDYLLFEVAREWRESGGYAALTLHHRYTRMGRQLME
jgi:hypothetical protein